MDWVYCGFVRPMYGSFIVVEREQEREKPKMEGRGLLEGLFFKLIIFFKKNEKESRREKEVRGERQRHIPWRMESSSSLPEREIKIRERKREREENERYFL